MEFRMPRKLGEKTVIKALNLLRVMEKKVKLDRLKARRRELINTIKKSRRAIRDKGINWYDLPISTIQKRAEY